MTRYWYISLTYATFAIITVDGRVKVAAPVAGWMIGQTLAELKGWLIMKRAFVEEIKM